MSCGWSTFFSSTSDSMSVTHRPNIVHNCQLNPTLKLQLCSLSFQTFSHVAQLTTPQTEVLLLYNWLRSCQRSSVLSNNYAAEIDLVLIHPLTTFSFSFSFSSSTASRDISISAFPSLHYLLFLSFKKIIQIFFPTVAWQQHMLSK